MLFGDAIRENYRPGTIESQREESTDSGELALWGLFHGWRPRL